MTNEEHTKLHRQIEGVCHIYATLCENNQPVESTTRAKTAIESNLSELATRLTYPLKTVKDTDDHIPF